MQMSIKKKIGKETYTFLVEGENFHATMMEANKLSFKDVHECGLCKSDDLELTARIAGKKNFPYVDIKCKNCRGSVTFGKTQDNPDVYFLRKVDTGQQGKNGKPIKKLDWKPFGQEHEDLVSE